MKKVLVLMLAAVLLAGIAGCATMPRGIQDALYTAQITSHVTAREAGEASVFPYKPADPNETDGEQLLRMQLAVKVMTNTLVQIDKNLIQVVNWQRGFTEDLTDANDPK